jgi:ankyrin repeat protein
MVVRSLIEIGGSRLDLNVAADNGAKALLIACNHDNHEIVSILIDQAGTRLDLNSTDGQGCTALIMASQMGLERMVRLLVEKGGERIDLNQVDNTGLTALACAGLANKLSIMNILLENTQVFVCAAKDLFLSNDMLDDPYIKLLTIAMTKKREEIFRLLSQSDIYLSAEARLHFVNQIQINPKHPINRILSCKKKTDQTSLFAEAHRDLMSELNAFFAANSLELGTRQVNTPP